MCQTEAAEMNWWKRGREQMISIVVPVYNAEKYIATTIEMVQRQTYTDWELILVDDCSKDHSVDVMKSCIGANSDKIRLIQKEVNEGAAMARNTIRQRLIADKKRFRFNTFRFQRRRYLFKRRRGATIITGTAIYQ